MVEEAPHRLSPWGREIGAAQWGRKGDEGREGGGEREGDKGGMVEEGGGVREECKSFGVRGARCSNFVRARNKFCEKISESYAFGTFFADM